MKLLVNGIESHEEQRFTYPGGELNVHFPELDSLGSRSPSCQTRLICRLQSTEDVMAMLLANEIIDRRFPLGNKFLMVPYLPYARQDRAQDTSAFSLKVMANLINSMNFKRVYTWDVHSHVSEALINNIDNVPLERICENHGPLLYDIEKFEYTLVSPDAGAEKKVAKLSNLLRVPYLTAYKIRDETTGKLSNAMIVQDKVPKNVCIIDDICDGGRTFINLAKVLRAKGTERVGLYITHGIFSQGLDVLSEIDSIYTTDTYLSKWHTSSSTKLHVKHITGL